MKKIILLHHREDKGIAKVLLAVLRRMLDGEHLLWSQDNLTALATRQLSSWTRSRKRGQSSSF